MAKVNILHLSDLHFGVERSDERPAKTALDLRANTLDELIKELKKIDDGWKPDIVVISGDIGWRGCADDYGDAQTWIEKKLLKVLELRVDDLVVCAGNHDINRNYTKGILPPSTPEDADDWLSIESLENFIRPFEGYNNFCSELSIPELSIKDQKYHLIGVRKLKDLRFVVLNSAWFSRKGEDGDKGKLWIGLKQLEVMAAASQLTQTENYDTGVITIAILHHPPEWLNDNENNIYNERKSTFNYLAQHSHIILTGHVHGRVDEPDRKYNSAYLFKGGATYAGDNYRNNFSLYQIDTEKRSLQRQIYEFDPPHSQWNETETEVMSLKKKPEYNGGTSSYIDLEIPPAYRKCIIDHCRYMDLKNLMPEGKAVSVELPELFIPLYTNSLDKETRIGNRDKAEHDLQEEEQKPIDIESLIVQNDYLLIEGQAGSGKTTLLKHTAFSIINQEFDESLNGYLPIMIFLKEIQGNKVTNDITAEIIFKSYCEPNGLAVDTIKAYCVAGKAIFLIDGLDEIDSGNRELVINAIAQFRNSYDNCKIILSGRPHGIDNVVSNLFGDKLVKVHPLIKGQIDTFISRWFRFVYSKGTEAGKKTAKEMIGEIEAHSGINELTETPLMLTAICILYYDKRGLPDQRAELYEKFVDNLIKRRYPSYQKVINFLNELAFKVHATGRRGFDNDEALKVLYNNYLKREKDENDEEYLQRLEANKQELDIQFQDIEQNCGLIKLENGKYNFWHLTIQEFLAARYIVSKKFEYVETTKEYWEDDWYKEVVRLLIGLLSLKNQGSANMMVDVMLGSDGDTVPFKRWLLASSSLCDIHKDNRNIDVVDKACDCLLSMIDSDAAPEIKVNAGETLGWLGDPRDLKEFILVEGGEYYLWGQEKPVNIEQFKMSRYPVTNSWYAEFIKDSGYSKLPLFWNDRKWTCPNSPVVGVSWYDAVAFADWYTMYKNDGKYRLAYENEWEAAAGGKEARIYPWGDKWDKNRCNNFGLLINRTSSVGIFANGNTPEEISDLSGNVWEWCMDKSGSDCVLYGGGWFDFKQRCRSAYRDGSPPDSRCSNIGFRLVFVP